MKGEERPVLVTKDRVSPMLFGVDVRSIEGETVLTLHGQLDMSTQQLFVNALAGVDDNVARIVLDLSDLTFIDCGNIGVIHQLRIVAGLRGTFLELRSPNPQLFRIMELTGLLASANGEQPGPIVLPLPSRAYERAGV
jgi:anti-anti-sigma factor